MTSRQRRKALLAVAPTAALLGAAAVGVFAVNAVQTKRELQQTGATSFGSVSPIGGGSFIAHGFIIADAAGQPNNLYPAANVRHQVKLTNRTSQTIQVNKVAAVVGQPRDAGGHPVTLCSAGTVWVDPLATPVSIVRGGTATVSLTVHMSSTAPVTCKSITFPLTYNGTAVSK